MDWAAARQPEPSGRAESLPSSLRLSLILGTAGLSWIAAGFLVWPSAIRLANFWLTDDLKSMGALIPLVCFALILRAWRSAGWNTRGTWWGIALLVFWAMVVFVRDQTLLVITVNKGWLLQIPPLPLVAVMYALGLVLALGGRDLLRRCWFPVLLMWAVIPVPQTFSRRVDLPLQYISAQVARSFAHLLRTPLTADRLRLMFTPNFGMFIAPGCNGIRGSITLGLAAIVVSYVYRFRWFVYAPVVLGSVMLGYLFNLLRLCLLVVYYKIALPYPWLQTKGEMADYLIGGTLFMIALGIFFTVVNYLREKPSDLRPAAEPSAPDTTPLRPFLIRGAALIVLGVLFAAEYTHLHAEEPVTARVIPRLPDHIGNYRLVDRYDDSLLDGVVVYTWGEYAGPESGSPHIKLGFSPVLDVHDVEVCHMTRGQDPAWHGQIDADTPGGKTQFSGFTYMSGTMQWLEASSVCDGGTCSEFNTSSNHVTMVYARPHRGLPLEADASRPVPVLLRIDTGDTSSEPSETAATLSVVLRDFLRQANLVELSKPYSHR
ncbi:exosortase J [Bryocella elongata]|uniref:Exosortase J n=2 Tax=Bryocella elongata TaxID=863522 RepID=A0A1H6BMP9_9BACT|nr:exosortase J [Bryocella elongata]